MNFEEKCLYELIPRVLLPDGYRGKFLLVSIVWHTQTMVALRSGDLWHREILLNTRAELKHMGISDARVDELGGAHVSFEAEGLIRIYGRSDEFGACDLEFAANLIRIVKPAFRVVVDSWDQGG